MEGSLNYLAGEITRRGLPDHYPTLKGYHVRYMPALQYVEQGDEQIRFYQFPIGQLIANGVPGELLYSNLSHPYTQLTLPIVAGATANRVFSVTKGGGLEELEFMTEPDKEATSALVNGYSTGTFLMNSSKNTMVKSFYQGEELKKIPGVKEGHNQNSNPISGD